MDLCLAQVGFHLAQLQYHRLVKHLDQEGRHLEQTEVKALDLTQGLAVLPTMHNALIPRQIQDMGRALVLVIRWEKLLE